MVKIFTPTVNDYIMNQSIEKNISEYGNKGYRGCFD